MTNILIIFWTAFWCQVYHVDPAFALGTFHIESRGHGQEFRVGLLARKWYGPANIAKEFKDKFLLEGIDITTLEGNCRVGVRALRGRDKLRILKRYNPQATQAYLRAVLGAEKRYRRMICR